MHTVIQVQIPEDSGRISQRLGKSYVSNCCILTSNTAKHAIPKTAEVAYSIGVGDLADNMGQG